LDCQADGTKRKIRLRKAILIKINLNEGYTIMSKLSIITELWGYLKVRKKWWLVPIVFFLLLIGIMLILAEGSAVAPFIYTLF